MSDTDVHTHPDSPPSADDAATTIPGSPKERVHHTYRDFSRFMDEGGRLPKQKKAGSNFPANLQRMLADERYSHIITWMPHGRAWKILDKRLLLSTAIPAYFGQTRFESFTRQLSHWGFRRLHGSGPDFGAYYHQCFLRGLPQLTAMMRRSPRKKTMPDAEGEPNFYLISERRPLPPLTALAPAIPAGQNSRLGAPALVQPGTTVEATGPTGHPVQEEGRDGDTERNIAALSARPRVTSPALSARPSHQIQNDALCASASAWARRFAPVPTWTDIPSRDGCDGDPFLMQARPVVPSCATEQRSMQGDSRTGFGADELDSDLFGDGDDCLRFLDVFDDDYLRFLSHLIKNT